MVHLMKHKLLKHEDLRSDPHYPILKVSMVASCNPSTGSSETGRSLGLAGRFSLAPNSVRNSISKNKGENNPGRHSVVHTQPHKHVHILTHTHTIHINQTHKEMRLHTETPEKIT